MELELISIMKALSDETRIRILNLLYHGELCVCELEVLLNINQSNASRHLSRLSNANIVDYYKKAQYIYYKNNETTLLKHPFIKEILRVETEKEGQFLIDLQRLEKYKRTGLSCDDLKDGKIPFDN